MFPRNVQKSVEREGTGEDSKMLFLAKFIVGVGPGGLREGSTVHDKSRTGPLSTHRCISATVGIYDHGEATVGKEKWKRFVDIDSFRVASSSVPETHAKNL